MSARALSLFALLAAFSAWGEAPDAGAPEKEAPKEAKPPFDVSKMPFTRPSIAKVMHYHQDKVQTCYEETLASKSKPVEGKLMTSFVITPEGLVKSARVESKGTTLKDRKLHECVIAVLTAMTFPQPPDKKNHPIQYPFNLKAVR